MEPLEHLDRKIADAAAALRTQKRALDEADAPGDVDQPLSRSRSVSSKAVYEELGEIGPSPHVDAMRTWVAALTLERVLWVDTARVAAARAAEAIVLDVGGARTRLSARAAFDLCLGDREPVRRRIVADAFARGVDGVRAAVRMLVERRIEAARLLGVDLDTLEIPVEPRDGLRACAEALLEATRDAAPKIDAWSDAFDVLMTRDAGEGWPAHLTPRWIAGLFDGTGLLDGLRLPAIALPKPLGAASFARALGAFGGALSDVDRPTGAPFCLAFAPFDVQRARRAGLFAGLAADPMFHVRALGLGRDRARDQARKVARGLVLGLRLDAARVLLRGALDREPGVAARAWEEATAVALGAPVSGLLAGVLPRVEAGDAARFVGSILAAADRRALVERFDQDWFKSPHAAHALRDEDGTAPAIPKVDKAELDRGVVEIKHWLGDLG